MSAALFGVGVGPGDPELLTLKAVRILNSCDVIAVPDKGSADKTALNIVRDFVKDKDLLFCDTPMIRDKVKLDAAYSRIADDICNLLNSGKSVAFITLGDPTVYSTYIYVHRKVLSAGFNAYLVPGVPSFCAAAARLNIPLCEGSERLLIIPASYDADDSFAFNANKVYMKAGSAISDLQQKLAHAGLLDSAAMVENCGMESERVFHNFADLHDNSGYFSIVIVKDSKGV